MKANPASAEVSRQYPRSTINNKRYVDKYTGYICDSCMSELMDCSYINFVLSVPGYLYKR